MIHYRLCGTRIQCVPKTGGFSMNITFDDNLITGNKTIDSQHQELIDRIRQFVAACESSDSKIKAIKMLDYLDEYTNFHFQEEEDLQKKVSYPELAGDQFIEQVKRNVVDWLFQHIKTFDRSVAEYIHLKDNSDRL